MSKFHPRAFSGFKVRGHQVKGLWDGSPPVGSRGKASVGGLGDEAEAFLGMKA